MAFYKCYELHTRRENFNQKKASNVLFFWFEVLCTLTNVNLQKQNCTYKYSQNFQHPTQQPMISDETDITNSNNVERVIYKKET